ncbi:outer membrane protein assembly factor BamB family protein [Microbulbifer guangxiensis]|uniref:outer membrane protein assembly factor BamB family protein n=1 Tax=Microbulbifer guangxiensis TaxID=2904249 RepID=UPI001F16CB76|nr:PQQ-binding-like beta-propeller repeat protein [Microbulbifer guangxiensis]
MPGSIIGRLGRRVRAKYVESLFKVTAIALSVGMAVGAFAGEFPVSAEQSVVRDRGKPATKIIPFNAPKAGEHYYLRIYNGSGAKSLVTAGSVSVNGNVVLANHDFNNNSEFFEIPLNLGLQNKLEITLSGSPGSGFHVEVIGVDEVSPEITAEISPSANTFGWHSSDVLVTFACSDDLSGVASCSDPITISSEGNDQKVTGTATDVAGNRAEIQAAVSLDKTPPSLEPSVAPQPNSAGWHRDQVTVSYRCADALSGIAECPASVQLEDEGADQPVKASATDIAGNRVSAETLLSIDTTSPTVTAELVAPPNAEGWHREPVMVTFNCFDALSGMDSCPEPVLVSDDGESQAITGSATDVAGNTGSAEIIVSLDQVAPELSFVSPADGDLLSEPNPQITLIFSDNLAIDVDSLQVYVDSAPVESCQVVGQQATCIPANPISGETEISLVASIGDLAGNNREVRVTTALDSDSDSVADFVDACPATAVFHSTDSNGCAAEQRDSDGDGVDDAAEIAAGTDPDDPSSFPELEIERFVASPGTVAGPGGSVELRWRVIGAQRIELSRDDGGEPIVELDAEGAIVVSPKISTNFTLTAQGPSGETRQVLTVTVEQSPPPQRWTTPSIPVKEQIATSLAVGGDGSAYMSTFDGHFYKVDPRGQVEWVLRDFGLVMGKASVSPERIIVGSNISGSGHQENAGRVYALSPDKTLLWQFDTEGAVLASPLLNDDQTLTYIVTYSGNIYALKSESGQQVWGFKLPAGQFVSSTPVLSGTNLIVHTESQKIFALATGGSVGEDRIIWKRKLSQ